MRRLLPFLALAACAPAPPLVTTVNPPQTASKYAVAGDSAAAIELRHQLETRGLYAADAAAIIHTGYAAAPRNVGTCITADRVTGTCKSWFYAPNAGFSPFDAPLRYRLVLSVDDGQIIVTQAGGKRAEPLAAMTAAGIARLVAR